MSVRVKVHTGAVRELLHSGGITGILESESQAAAARCNGMVEWHSPMADPYVAFVDDGGYTSIGKVAMRRGLGKDGMAAQHYEAKHAVLLKGSGW